MFTWKVIKARNDILIRHIKSTDLAIHHGLALRGKIGQDGDGHGRSGKKQKTARSAPSQDSYGHSL